MNEAIKCLTEEKHSIEREIEGCRSALAYWRREKDFRKGELEDLIKRFNQVMKEYREAESSIELAIGKLTKNNRKLAEVEQAIRLLNEAQKIQ